MLTSFGNGRACFDTDLSNKECNKMCHFCVQKMVPTLIHYCKHCTPFNGRSWFSAKEGDYLKYTEETK